MVVVDDAVRFGCVFCGHRQDDDSPCARCQKQRTLDLRDAGVRELFRDTEVRAREKREGRAKTIGVICGMLTMAGTVIVTALLPFSLWRRPKLAVGVTVGLGFAVAIVVMEFLERKLDRKLFPWLDTL